MVKGSGSQNLNKLKVPELKKELKDRGLDTSGKKADLVARLEEALKKEEQENAQVEETVSSDVTKEEEEVKPQEEKVPAKDDTQSSNEEAQKEQEQSAPQTEESVQSATTENAAEESEHRSRQESQSPPERMEDESPEPKKRKSIGTEEQDNKAGSTATSTNGNNTNKRQRKWVDTNKQKTELSISTDTLDEMLVGTKPVKTKQPSPVQEEQEQEAPQPTITRIVVPSTKDDKDKESDLREVPPPRKPVSRTLFIDRFVRPFTLNQVKELLGKTGEIEFFWMNGIKSQCYVIYKTEEQAIATREAIYNLLWPPANHSRLRAEFATEEEARRAAERSEAQKNGAAAPAAAAQPQPQPHAHTRPTEQRDSRHRAASAPAERAAPPPPAKTVTLEDLFRKTQARPCIYWLPLSDDEVQKKQQQTSRT
jgi:apoptotic chromatin condensation inducer in the nucleus